MLTSGVPPQKMTVHVTGDGLEMGRFHRNLASVDLQRS